MPMYEYACDECGTTFETLVRAGAEPTACEQCGGTRIRKLLSAFAVGKGEKREAPSCAGGCGNGYEQGSCGSGMCCGGHGHD